MVETVSKKLLIGKWQCIVVSTPRVRHERFAH